MTAISATTIGSRPTAGTHRETQGTNNTRGICAPTIQAIVSQNHKYFLMSHRTFIAIKIVMADSQAARPVPDFPTELNRKMSGNVRAATAMAESQVVSCFFLPAFSSSGFYNREVGDPSPRICYLPASDRRMRDHSVCTYSLALTPAVFPMIADSRVVGYSSLCQNFASETIGGCLRTAWSTVGRSSDPKRGSRLPVVGERIMHSSRLTSGQEALLTRSTLLSVYQSSAPRRTWAHRTGDYGCEIFTKVDFQRKSESLLHPGQPRRR
jgi:hypothetical protein